MHFFSWIYVIQMISNCSRKPLELVACLMDVFESLYKYISDQNNFNQLSYSRNLRSNITFSQKLSNIHFLKPRLYFHIQKRFKSNKLYSFEKWYWFDIAIQKFFNTCSIVCKNFIIVFGEDSLCKNIGGAIL